MVQDWEVAHIPQVPRPVFFLCGAFFFFSPWDQVKLICKQRVLFSHLAKTHFFSIFYRNIRIISVACSCVRCSVLFPISLEVMNRNSNGNVFCYLSTLLCEQMPIRKKASRVALMPAEAVDDTAFPRHWMHWLPRPKCNYELQIGLRMWIYCALEVY